MNRTRVLLADDHRIVTEGLKGAVEMLERYYPEAVASPRGAMGLGVPVVE